MSQAGILSTDSSPQVPTQFDTDSGNAVPVGNVLEILGAGTVTTSASGNTVTITGAGSSELTGTASITGAVTGDIITFDLGGAAAVYRFIFKTAGRDTGTGDGVGYTVDASARTDGASATIIQTPFIDADEDASLVGALIDVIASGNNIILQATGVAGQTISYSANGTYIGV